MVKAELIYRDFNDLAKGDIKFYTMVFTGNQKVVKILKELLLVIDDSRLVNLEDRVRVLNGEINLNKREIKYKQKSLNIIKSQTNVLNLLENIKELKKLTKEIKMLKQRNKEFEEHIKSLLKIHEQSFYYKKNTYRNMLAEYGFVCTETRVRCSSLNIETYESSLSDEQIYEKVSKKLNREIIKYKKQQNYSKIENDQEQTR